MRDIPPGGGVEEQVDGGFGLHGGGGEAPVDEEDGGVVVGTVGELPQGLERVVGAQGPLDVGQREAPVEAVGAEEGEPTMATRRW